MALIAKLLISFPMQQAGEKAAEMRAGAYIEALEYLPTYAIAQACREWLRGESGDYNYTWSPSPPVLRTRALVAKQRVDVQISSLKRLLEADIIPDPPEFTDEHRGKMLVRLSEMFKSIYEKNSRKDLAPNA